MLKMTDFEYTEHNNGAKWTLVVVKHVPTGHYYAVTPDMLDGIKSQRRARVLGEEMITKALEGKK